MARSAVWGRRRRRLADDGQGDDDDEGDYHHNQGVFDQTLALLACKEVSKHGLFLRIVLQRGIPPMRDLQVAQLVGLLPIRPRILGCVRLPECELLGDGLSS